MHIIPSVPQLPNRIASLATVVHTLPKSLSCILDRLRAVTLLNLYMLAPLRVSLATVLAQCWLLEFLTALQ
jgi:hypothetical protein